MLKVLKGSCSSGVEHFLGKEEVMGSNPIKSSIRRKENGPKTEGKTHSKLAAVVTNPVAGQSNLTTTTTKKPNDNG